MIEDENKVMDILRRVKPPSALAAILSQYTSDKVAEIFSKLTPQQSASAMSSMFAKSPEGAREIECRLGAYETRRSRFAFTSAVTVRPTRGE